MRTDILDSMGAAQSREQLFDIFANYFNDQGATGIAYMAPATAIGPFELIQRGIPEHWIRRYHEENLKEKDPLLGTVFRLEEPVGLESLLEALPTLSRDEKCFIHAFKTTSGITNGIAIPAFGPYGRPAFIGLTQFEPIESMEALNRQWALAVSQVFHIRMEALLTDEPLPRLSPREREVT